VAKPIKPLLSARWRASEIDKAAARSEAHRSISAQKLLQWHRLPEANGSAPQTCDQMPDARFPFLVAAVRTEGNRGARRLGFVGFFQLRAGEISPGALRLLLKIKNPVLQGQPLLAALFVH
jgi:hypothetical protein